MVCLFFISILSCEFGEDGHKNVQTEYITQKIEIEEVDSSVEENNIEKDSVVPDKQEDIGYLLKETTKAKTEIEVLHNTIRELRDSRSTFITITIIVLIVIVITILYILYKLGDKMEYNDGSLNIANNKLNRQNLDLVNLSKKVEELNRDILNLGGRQTSSKDLKLSSDLENRINKLELKISLLDNKTTYPQSLGNSMVSTPIINESHEDSLESSKISKVGYADINKGSYFIEIMNSQKETCVYKVTFETQKSGYFDLISLDKIKYRNGWDDVIDYEGDCSMEEASSYTLIEHGVINKYDEKIWEVTKKLKIRVSK